VGSAAAVDTASVLAHSKTNAFIIGPPKAS
jgi:hypothetical protein